MKYRLQKLAGNRRLLLSGVTSLIVHFVALTLLLLMIVPMQRRVFQQTEVRLLEPDYGAELIVLDVELPEVDDQAPQMVDLVGAMRQATLEVETPLAEVATVAGSGKHQADAGSSDDGGGSGQRRASFFGTQAEGDHFVYVLDVSGSMGNGGGRRLRRATEELLRSIDSLTTDQFFHVILFSTRARAMFDQVQSDLQMFRATTENKERLRDWLATTAPQGGTHPQGALRLALELRPSAVFFLSDGAFSKTKASDRARKRIMTRIERGVVGGYRLLEAREVVRVTNRDQTPVHTVAFEEVISAKDMSEISELTGGTFRFVAPPPRKPSRIEEREAQDALTRAHRLHSQGKVARADMAFIYVVRKYPGTRAAREVLRNRPELFGPDVATELAKAEDS